MARPEENPDKVAAKSLISPVRWKSLEEREQVEGAAKHSGFATEKQSGVSRYMRAVVLGHNPTSIFDKEVMVELCRIHADLGRVGGLFKLAATVNMDIPEVRNCARELAEVKRELKTLIAEIREGRWNA